MRESTKQFKDGCRIRDSRSEDIWSNFASALQTVFNHCADSHDDLQWQLQQRVNEMYPLIMGTPELKQALAACPQKHALTAPSWSTALYQDSHCHIGLVAVYRGQQMPLHDHAGAFSLSIVITGRARIRYAKQLDLNQASGLTHILVAGMQDCAERQVCFQDKQNNLHSIEAKSARVQVLVVHMPKIDRDRQAFYFPLEDKQWRPGQRIRAKRIRVRYNVGH
ncbi:MAG: hypothetical protein PVG20_00330 [Thioalkalispiraceae bacterium]